MVKMRISFLLKLSILLLAFSAMMIILPQMPFGIKASAATDESGLDIPTGEYFRMQVTVTADDLTFAIPLSGNGGQSTTPYNWRIYWNDDSSYEVKSKNSLAPGTGSTGITHTYASAGTYTITIIPDSGNDAWFRAFGFHNTNMTNANTQANRDKVTKILSPFTPLMTRSQASINNVTELHNEWRNAFYGCSNLTLGNNATFDGWDGITSVGISFAFYMFSGCSSLEELPAGFNLPSDITTVGNNFAAYMFNNCSSLTSLGSLTLPTGITTVGNSFACYMFYNCSSLASLPDDFNFPQGITTFGSDFAFSMFNSAGSSAFQINNALQLPTLSAANLGGSNVFKNTFSLNINAPTQSRTAASIIGTANLTNAAGLANRSTFGSHFSDLRYIPTYFGGSDYTRQDATFTAAANGSASANTTAINLVFDTDVSGLGLTTSDFVITSAAVGGGAVTVSSIAVTGAYTDGKHYTLTVTPTTAGTVTISGVTAAVNTDLTNKIDYFIGTSTAQTLTIYRTTNDATISAYTLGGVSGSLGTPNALYGSAAAGTVTITTAEAVNPTFLVTKATGATVKYAYTATNTAPSFSATWQSPITLADNSYVWVEVTALDGTTKLIYKINVTVINPSHSLYLKTATGLHKGSGASAALIPQGTASPVLGGGSYTYDSETKILTLTNVDFTTTAATALDLYNLPAGGTVTLVGDNSFESLASSSSYGINFRYSATISGAGTLTAIGKQYGINTTSALTISGGTVTATGVSIVNGRIAGIYSGSSTAADIIISGSATVIATGGSTGSSDRSSGIYSGRNVSISDSATVTATSGYSDSGSYGIFSEGTVSISGGTVTAQTNNTGLGTTRAFNKTPSTYPDNYRWEYSTTVPVTTPTTGTNNFTFDNTYRYVRIAAFTNTAPNVVTDEDEQNGTATPEPASGTIDTSAVAYSGDASDWFEDAEGDTLTYSLVSAVSGATDVSTAVIVTASTGAISYTPAAAQAGSTVIIIVKANDGAADSSANVTITVTVGAVPANKWAVTLTAYDPTTPFTALTQYTEGTDAALPTGGAKTGYAFGGWYTTSDFSTAAVTSILTTDTGDKTFYAKWLSTTATLATLTISEGTLTPAFVAGTGTSSYTASVANSVDSVTIGATATEANATITASGLGAKDLDVGENTFSVVSTAQDGTTTATYTIVITRAAETTPPTVSTVSPSGTGVSQATTTLTVTFSEAMNTLNGTITLDNGVTAASPSWTNGNTAVTYTLSTLAYSTEYTLTFTGFTDAAGNALTTPSPAKTFTTAAAPDTAAPTVSGDPVFAATDLSLGTGTLTVTFSEAMTAAGTITLDNSGTATLSTWSSTNVAVYNLTGLTYGTTYEVTFASFTDAAGNALTAPSPAMTFTTATEPDTTAPTVLTVTPSGTDVSQATTALTVTFSEAMNTLNGTITLDNGVTAASPSWTNGNTAATYTLSTLGYGTTYTITFASFTDAAGNALTAPSPAKTFTTAAEPAPDPDPDPDPDPNPDPDPDPDPDPEPNPDPDPDPNPDPDPDPDPNPNPDPNPSPNPSPSPTPATPSYTPPLLPIITTNVPMPESEDFTYTFTSKSDVTSTITVTESLITITAGLNESGSVNSETAVKAMKESVRIAKANGENSVYFEIPEGAVGLSSSTVKKLVDASGGLDIIINLADVNNGDNIGNIRLNKTPIWGKSSQAYILKQNVFIQYKIT